MIERAGLSAVDASLRVAMLPFRRRSPREREVEDLSLVEHTDELNVAAEQYFVDYPNKQFLLDKPYSDVGGFGRHLINLGLLVEGLQLRPGDRVLEFGAGSCWLSHMLNRYGCRTVSVDVSDTALQLGRELFERDPHTRWELEPQFLGYDGRNLPLGDGSCDYIVVNDAFHHVPNQKQVLTELYRVLTVDGLVGMSEPGSGHGEAPQSRQETEATGVLENELDLGAIVGLARQVGFHSVKALVGSSLVRHEIDAIDLHSFMGGANVAPYWKTFCSALEQHYYLLFYKSRPQLSTRRPNLLTAAIAFTPPDLTIASGGRSSVRATITNTGDTRWLASAGVPGWTRLGVHLERADGAPVDHDWLRVSLPRDVAPGEVVEIDVSLQASLTPGDYRLSADLVIEGVLWFAERGSRPAVVRLRID